jgi:hypothetical protein
MLETVYVYDGNIDSKLLVREANKLRILQKVYNILYSLSSVFISVFVLINLLYFSGVNIKIPERFIIVFVVTGVATMLGSRLIHKYVLEKEDFISSMVEVIKKG